MYRVYCDGIDFGLNYLTLADARIAKLKYAIHFPRCKYYIRKIARFDRVIFEECYCEGL